MKKEIRVSDEKKGIVQITTLDERWYARPTIDKTTGLPASYEFLPSVTWIAGYYPKGIAFYKWLADKGWDEAESIKISAGNKGSKVHQGCQILDNGGEIKLSDNLKNPTTNLDEELTVEEVDCLLSYRNWHLETKPQILANEITVFGDGYAGTIDKIIKIDGQVWLVDLKTSQNIWEEHILQVSAYSHSKIDSKNLNLIIRELNITDEEWANRKLAILQVGYRKNKAGYKFTEIEDKYELFKMAFAIWQNENPDTKPKQRDYPLVIRIIEKIMEKPIEPEKQKQELKKLLFKKKGVNEDD